MKNKTLLTLCLMAFATMGIWAQGPNNSGTYYKNADGKSGQALKTALYNIIKNPSTSSYSGLKEAYKKTDVRADGYLRDWYSNTTKYTPGTSFSSSGSEGQGYNREHTIPQSWFGEATPMKSDIVHVVPTDCAINGMRSDFPFGEVDSSKRSKYKESKNGYSKFGYSKTPGYTDLVFEPNDEIKGDLARIYFYMATCYENQIATWTKANGGTVIQGDSYQPYVQWTYDMLVRWSQLDPVDDVERARNKAAQEVQKNRNPFVDYPRLEDYIWGSKKEVPFSYDNYDSSIVIAERVEQPVFSPEGGTFTDSVTVTISCATDGAIIYYTTDGNDATEGSNVYEGPITLTKTTTLKAVAAKDTMTTSYQTTATYVIKSSHPGDVTTDEVTIALNSTTLGTLTSGKTDYSVTKDGITVTYAKGSSANQYISDSQIRVYPGNTLTVSSADNNIACVELTKVGGKGDKVLLASTGTVSDMTWTGDAQSVVFRVNDGNGHIQFSQVKVMRIADTPEPPQPVKGDVNGDGAVDVADISAIISVMAGGIAEGTTGSTGAAADVNGDGAVDVADISAVISIMAGSTLISE